MTRRRMITAYYDDDSGELTECLFSDEWLTSGNLMRLDTIIDLLHAVIQARDVEMKGWASEWKGDKKGRRDVH